LNNIATFKSGLEVTEDSKAWVLFPIRIL